ncbi:hypothetical protein [Roseomonas sp. CECT 9278]|uniref:hypothetical protein n=1 Tax=Roseomonas sp. CECT 9278 TaxID=2845823 RepID=UPI001E3DEB89|nr:hypothetical protein [Roseomonas sp. CECT 9278]CAH0275583.1 hypothetical protein ROS9278_03791 [Roseomonas sp. CECT 9278]
MPRTTPRIDAWPLLPRSAAGWAEGRPVDEPARAAFDAMAGIAAALLALRWLLPQGALAHEFAAQVALWGGLGGMAVTAAILALVGAMPLAMPLMGMVGPLKDVALRAFDHAVHLALVMSCAGMVGALVLFGHVSVPVLLFAGQAALLVLCYRTRIWLAGERTA